MSRCSLTCKPWNQFLLAKVMLFLLKHNPGCTLKFSPINSMRIPKSSGLMVVSAWYICFLCFRAIVRNLLRPHHEMALDVSLLQETHNNVFLPQKPIWTPNRNQSTKKWPIRTTFLINISVWCSKTVLKNGPNGHMDDRKSENLNRPANTLEWRCL